MNNVIPEKVLNSKIAHVPNMSIEELENAYSKLDAAANKTPADFALMQAYSTQIRFLNRQNGINRARTVRSKVRCSNKRGPKGY